MSQKSSKTPLYVAAAAFALGGVFYVTMGRGEQPPPIYDTIMRFWNFAILLAALIYFVRKPVVDGIRGSIESVRDMLAEAEESRKEAEARMKEAEDRLAGIEQEITDLVTHAKEESEVEKDRILAEAAESVERLKKEAAATIEQELKKSQDLLKKEVASMAVTLAEEMIEKNVGKEDQARFVNEYLEKLEVSQ
jgi:F-type H+-transporting ATPase subunit b